MDAPIRFAHTADGLAIPYTVTGRGYPLVEMPGGFCSIASARWAFPWPEALARRFRYITYDRRGLGQAPRGITSFTIDDILTDLEAVVDSAGVHRFILKAGFWCGPPAVRFAAEHPESVAALILLNTYPPSPPVSSHPGGEAMMRDDWDQFLRLIATGSRHCASDDELQEYIAFLRMQVVQGDWLIAMRDSVEFDVSTFVESVRAPVLVLGSPTTRHADHAARMAAAVLGARFALLPYSYTVPFGEQAPPTLDAIDAFLADVLPEAVRGGEPRPAVPALSTNGRALSAREREVLRLLAAGRTNREIAEALVLSPATVSRHVANLYAKLGVHRKAEAVAAAIAAGIGPQTARTT